MIIVNKTGPMLMILDIQVVNQITLIPRNIQENVIKMVHIRKKEINLMIS